MRPHPDRIGRFEILVPLGTGGMATVYLARVRGLGGFEREVAVKVIHPHLRQQGDWEKELLEEAKLAALIRHPNVVSVSDVGDSPFGVFLVMDYIEGETAAALLGEAVKTRVPLSIPLALRILSDALSGLHAAHELRSSTGTPLGLVHRDFSPQNILVGTDGISRLTDFGIAKAASRQTITGAGLVKGKIDYMSPEQARGHALDRRTDVWAAGVLAWELLANRRLHDSTDDTAKLLRIVSDPMPRLRDVCPELPAALDQAVAAALESDIERRTASAELFRRQLLDGAGAQLADVAEVAERVYRLAGPALEERRSHAEEARQARKDPIEPAASPPSNEGRFRRAEEELPEMATVSITPVAQVRRRTVAILGGVAAAVAIAAVALVAGQSSSKEPPRATIGAAERGSVGGGLPAASPPMAAASPAPAAPPNVPAPPDASPPPARPPIRKPNPKKLATKPVRKSPAARAPSKTRPPPLLQDSLGARP